MRICVGQVISNKDFAQRGSLFVYAKEVMADPIEVIYTSQYASLNLAGFIAIPEVGTQVLIVRPERSTIWYFMGATFEPSQESGKNKILNDPQGSTLIDPHIYRSRGTPQRVILQDMVGNKLSLVGESNKRYTNKKIELVSSGGKKISLNDSKNNDSILIRNEHGDKIKLTADADIVSPARSIELICKGPQTIHSLNSGMDLRVFDGREINIENESTGLYVDPSDPERYGNINLVSQRKDINITVKHYAGKVFVDALGDNGHVQIDSEGTITIWAGKNIKIRGGENLDVKVNGNINIQAGGNINLKASGELNLEGGSGAGIGSAGNVRVEGSRVDLNSNNPVNAQEANITVEDRKINSYGN